MRKALKLFVPILCFLLPVKVFAEGRILVVLGSEGLIYSTAYSSFLENLSPETRKKAGKIVFSRNIRRLISRHNPDLIIAIGNNALSGVSHIRKIPVGFMMCTDVEKVSEKRNFFGIIEEPDICDVQKKITSLIPSLKSFIILADNEEKTAVECEHDGSLIKVTAENSAGLVSVMKKYAASADAVCIDPESRLLTQETMEYLFQFSLENRVPLISLSVGGKFLKAAMTVEADPVKTGAELAKMAEERLADPSTSYRRIVNGPPAIRGSKRTLKMLGLDIEGE